MDTMASEWSHSLRDAYVQIALSGTKRIDPPGIDGSGPASGAQRSLEVLEAAGLASREGQVLSLQLPEHAKVPIPEHEVPLLQEMYGLWLRAGEHGDDDVLYGDLGFWQHWWNVLHTSATSEVSVDVVVANERSFGERDWARSFDQDVLSHVFATFTISGRLLVPPLTIHTAAESIIDTAQQFGLDVRILPTAFHYVVFDSTAVLLTEESVDREPQVHRLTRRPSMVAPLARLFAMQWAADIPLADYQRGTPGLLHLMARGWTDERIAEALCISTRTVSRRVAEAMEAAGVRTRFELGMKYALGQPAVTPLTEV